MTAEFTTDDIALGIELPSVYDGIAVWLLRDGTLTTQGEVCRMSKGDKVSLPDRMREVDSRCHGPVTTNPRISIDPDNKLDDFMATNIALVHFEALDQSRWYATVELDDGQVWQLHFGAENPRAYGYAHVEQITKEGDE